MASIVMFVSFPTGIIFVSFITVTTQLSLSFFSFLLQASFSSLIFCDIWFLNAALVTKLKLWPTNPTNKSRKSVKLTIKWDYAYTMLNNSCTVSDEIVKFQVFAEQAIYFEKLWVPDIKTQTHNFMISRTSACASRLRVWVPSWTQFFLSIYVDCSKCLLYLRLSCEWVKSNCMSPSQTH